MPSIPWVNSMANPTNKSSHFLLLALLENQRLCAYIYKSKLKFMLFKDCTFIQNLTYMAFNILLLPMEMHA
jgi:hypothetical protein